MTTQTQTSGTIRFTTWDARVFRNAMVKVRGEFADADYYIDQVDNDGDTYTVRDYHALIDAMLLAQNRYIDDGDEREAGRIYTVATLIQTKLIATRIDATQSGWD